MNFNFDYKICTKSEWQETKKKGLLTGSKKDLEDGYIHLSADNQVAGTLKKFYQNQKDLILLKIDTLKLDHLIWEQASDGNMFPHLYSSLDISNVIEELEIEEEYEKTNNYCEECKKEDESVFQNLILSSFKICNSCKTAKTIFPL
jgi:uncharacterized protein (DUF952 family)